MRGDRRRPHIRYRHRGYLNQMTAREALILTIIGGVMATIILILPSMWLLEKQLRKADIVNQENIVWDCAGTDIQSCVPAKNV